MDYLFKTLPVKDYKLLKSFNNCYEGKPLYRPFICNAMYNGRTYLGLPVEELKKTSDQN